MNVFRIDFEKEKIYRYIWVKEFKNVPDVLDLTVNDVKCPLAFAFDVIGISSDGMSLAEDNSSKTTYYSVKTADSYTPKSFEESQTASASDTFKAWSLQKSTGKIYELSTEEKDSSGLEFSMKTAKKYNFTWRFDLTKLPPQLEIFDATESVNP